MDRFVFRWCKCSPVENNEEWRVMKKCKFARQISFAFARNNVISVPNYWFPYTTPTIFSSLRWESSVNTLMNPTIPAPWWLPPLQAMVVWHIPLLKLDSRDEACSSHMTSNGHLSQTANWVTVRVRTVFGMTCFQSVGNIRKLKWHHDSQWIKFYSLYIICIVGSYLVLLRAPSTPLLSLSR